MQSIKSVSFALDPKNVPTFLLDWELTKLCNLDCSYCGTGIDGGHDNTVSHPSLEQCLSSIDFMYEYIDLYMSYKKPSQRKVILNVYGGESLLHPDIVTILQEARQRYKKYADKWHLTICTTTNAVIGESRWKEIVSLIDNFTISYHSETLAKQKDLFKKNALYLKKSNKRFRAVVMMHNNDNLWQDGVEIINFLKEHGIEYTPKPLDNHSDTWSYSQEQFKTLKTFWINRIPNRHQESDYLENVGTDDTVNSIKQGRPCCGNRKLCVNGEIKKSMTFVPRQGFEGWSCSVNWFFLYVRQQDGNVFTNKDCMMNFDGEIAPIGNLKDSESILTDLQSRLLEKTLPVISCKKQICMCGFCAPKAEDISDFSNLMKYHVIDNPIKNS
jgi:sulfatase maturation enzyme AslB (radical SAM superfamily)